MIFPTWAKTGSANDRNGTFRHSPLRNFASKYVLNPESGTGDRMLPIRWIMPIVGALFALALLPWVFSPPFLKTNVMLNEHPGRQQAIVPIGIQRKELNTRDFDAPPIDTVASLPDARDVTGSADATSPVATKPTLKTATKHTKRVRRPTVYRRAKYARAATNFGSQRWWHIPKQEFKFNAN